MDLFSVLFKITEEETTVQLYLFLLYKEKFRKRALKPLWRWTTSSVKYDNSKWQKNLFPVVENNLGEDWWL